MDDREQGSAPAGKPAPEGAPRQPTPEERAAARAGRKRAFARFGVIAAVLAVLGFLYWLHARRFEDTDDAQIDGDISAVSPRVAGNVTAVHVVDNQVVKQGDVLVELDPTDLEVALAQAKAALAQAQAQLEQDMPGVDIMRTSNRAGVTSAQQALNDAQAALDAARKESAQLKAQLASAEAQDRLAKLQLERGKQLLEGKVISQSDFDQRQTQAEAAAAAVEAAREGIAAASQRIDQRKAQVANAKSRLGEAQQNAPRTVATREAGVAVGEANLEAAKARLRQAELNLGYAKVVAPADGIVGRKSVNLGDRVQPGQLILAITQSGRLWVTANFRETQLKLMRPGQHAKVHVDAIGRDYEGEVESIAGATGSRYSLLPPENATGNYVKVVQRIPVRIKLEPGQPEMERLRPGMSVEPEVTVR